MQLVLLHFLVAPDTPLVTGTPSLSRTWYFNPSFGSEEELSPSGSPVVRSVIGVRGLGKGRVVVGTKNEEVILDSTQKGSRWWPSMTRKHT